MSENECSQCGQDLRLPPINFRRMNWIIKLADKLAIADRRWLIERLYADMQALQRKLDRPRPIRKKHAPRAERSE